MKLDFSTFFHGLFREDFGVPSLHSERKNIALVFVFLLGKPGFPMGYAFFCINIKKILTALFLLDTGGHNGFSLKNSGGELQFAAEDLR